MAWDTSSIYSFGDDTGMLDIRVRRLERGRQTIRNGALVAPSSDLTLLPAGLLSDGSLNLAASNLVTAGSIPPTGFSGTFGFTATDTQIVVYWDGTNGSTLFKRLGTDGTVVNIPGGSMTITGLTASTTYGFLPYWSAYNNCGLGWIVGDAGSPQFAFTAAARTNVALQQQLLIGREPVTSGFITYPTTSGGSSSGGGGGGGTCVRIGTDIETLGGIEYSTTNHHCCDWFHIQAEGVPRSLDCTPDHPLFLSSVGRVEAHEIIPGDLIITDLGERKVTEAYSWKKFCTKVEVKMPQGHLFWANGYLSHNMKPLFP